MILQILYNSKSPKDFMLPYISSIYIIMWFSNQYSLIASSKIPNQFAFINKEFHPSHSEVIAAQ